MNPLSPLRAGSPPSSVPPNPPPSAPAPTPFKDVLAEAQNVRFSNHAQKRLESRQIYLDDQNVNRLSEAIDKAEKRGGKSSLVMLDDLAFIVNVPSRTVLTALRASQSAEGVFTQIDSVVIAEPAVNIQR